MTKIPRTGSMKRANMEYGYYCKLENGKPELIKNRKDFYFSEAINKILLKHTLFCTIMCLLGSLAVTTFAVFLPQNGVFIPNWILVFPILLCAILAILSVCYVKKNFLLLQYCVDSESELLIRRRKEALSYLNACSKLWRIAGYEHVVYARVNAGANRNVQRCAVKLRYKSLPYYMRMNYDNNCCYQLKSRGGKYFFLPDRLLLKKGSKFTQISYETIKIGIVETPIVEMETVPQDAKILYSTWQNVNIDGTPDRRFSYNREIPVCEYAEIRITGYSGLIIPLLVSNVKKAVKFKELYDAHSERLIALRKTEKPKESNAPSDDFDYNRKDTSLLVMTLSLIILIVAICVGSFVANINPSEYMAMTNVDGTLIIMDCNNETTELVIPDKIQGKTVTIINVSSFSDNEIIETVTIPYAVKQIGDAAFQNCRNLKTVTIKAKTPPKLGEYVFHFYSNYYIYPRDLKIYVPEDSVSLYKTEWAEYAQLIYPDKE